MFLSLIKVTIPSPGTDLKDVISNNSNPLSTPATTIASPNGCSDPFSAEEAYLNNSSSLNPLVTISVTLGLPSVIVPVLSNTTVLIL